MTNKKHFLWMGLGSTLVFLMGLLAIIAYHAITWAPVLLEIASVTWNDGPTI